MRHEGRSRGHERGGRVPGWRGLLVAVLAPVAAGGLFARLVSRYAFLGDDCFIAFRYARNLLAGHGLVFNPGEQVEGYTDFLWVVLMAGAGRAGAPLELASIVLGIASGAFIVFVVAWLGARESGWTNPIVWVAPLSLAANRSFCAWSTGGLETQFFAALVLAGLVRFAVERETESRRPWGSAALLAVATLTRPEGVIFFGAAALLFAIDVVRKRRALSSLAVWIAPYAAVVGAHVVWRLAYYGYPLPNTFYAKVSGVWLSQSLRYLGLFLGDHHLAWLLPLVGLALVPRARLLNVLFATSIAVYVVYVLAIGGDRFEFRLMTPVLPLIFWLMQDGIRRSARRWSRGPRFRAAVAAAATAAAVLVFGAAFRPNMITYPPERHDVASIEDIRAYAIRRAGEGRFLGSLVAEGYLSGDELLATGGAGALPYYSGLPVLDVYGLNDADIAHRPIAERGRIAHEKVATREELRERGVVIVDVSNGIVWPEGARPPFLRATAEKPFYSGPLRAVVAKGRYLTFGTTLDDERFREVFRRFEIVQ